MPETKTRTWGGHRDGAGRKVTLPPTVKAVKVMLTPGQQAKLKRLGGSRWVADQIEAAPDPDAIADRRSRNTNPRAFGTGGDCRALADQEQNQSDHDFQHKASNAC